MTDVRVKLVETHHEMEACVDLRVRVFVDEQGSPPDEEIDEYDRPAVHAAAILDGRVIGTGRLYRPGSGETQIGRMAVDPAYRRRGIGSLLLSFLEEVANQTGRHRGRSTRADVRDAFLRGTRVRSPGRALHGGRDRASEDGQVRGTGGLRRRVVEKKRGTSSWQADRSGSL